MNIVYGKNSVLGLLNNEPEKINKIAILKTVKSDKIEEIINICKTIKVRYEFLDKQRMDSYGRDLNHQGVIAVIEEYKYADVSEIEDNDKSLIIVLDQITDPHNLGAIIRSAAGCGVQYIIIPERNSCGVNETVLKVASGNASKVKIIKVTNINNTVTFLKSKGYWIVGTDMENGSEFTSYKPNSKTALVMGSEGEGIRRLVKDNCDDFVYIPLQNNVESLNVSVAAGIIMFNLSEKINKN
ncbi:MAG: 23S rRNA (guanosine(2251)-2'-O)-methyltransferase RlmB [Candidatus Delongbacteria bacterium]|nr:23S rRNA (guanosine(2251)-2'-O)-methyltransferase RlmB [Candidatus Delongbacteria bacterium]MBN2835651.1 23S rRNA (guanosine(2251)-2'-O)-methyltransferase RlmB [Candidatus Delongbacteria bacterium]